MSTQATPRGGAGGAPQRDTLLALADRSLASYLRYLAAYGGAVLTEPGVLLFAGAHRQPNPYRNGVLRLGDTLGAQDTVARGNAFFAERRSGYVLWVREHGDAELQELARVSGLTELDRLPELWMDELPDYLPPPDGVQLRRAADPRTREDYLAVVADAWGMRTMPRAVSARVFFDPESLAVPNVAAFVAYFDGRPLSAAMTYLDGDVALGCQAATIRRPQPGQALPRPGRPGEYRGLAESCLWAALALSFQEMGARLSLCQTSVLGAPIWQAFGYRPFTSYGRYLVPVARADGR
jgi:hypothetical protein